MSIYARVDRMSRRRLLTIPLDMVAALCGLTAAAAGLLRMPVPHVFPTPNRRFRIGKRQEFPPGTARYFERGRVLVRTDQRGVSALLLVCTHLGCTVKPNADGKGFFCPCDGSRFRDDGSVAAGPASMALRHLEVVRDYSGWLLVDAGRYVTASMRLEI